MKRILGAALAALMMSGGFSVAAGQNPGDHQNAQRREVFSGRKENPVEVRDRHGSEPRIPRGTDIPVTLDEDIPITTENIGDRFEGHVTRDVEVNGEVVLASGSPVEVQLVESDSRNDAATLRLERVNVNGDSRSVETDVAKADTDERGLGTLEKTGVGAAAGAIVGAVTGAGIIEGAVVGAGGGLAWGLLDKDGRRQIDDDTTLRFSLEDDLDL